MIDEIQRDQFLANPQQFARTPCLAVAAVAGDDAEEPGLSESWDVLKERLNGVGTRNGYRAFLALIQASEAELRNVVTEFSEQSRVRSFWRFVAAPIYEPESSLAVLQDVEWRAHKEVQYPETSALKVIGATSAR